MVLKGQAKTDYMREYMREYRKRKKNKPPQALMVINQNLPLCRGCEAHE